MRHHLHTWTAFFLTVLLAVSVWVPLSARAEVQMRCAGAAPQLAPCARAELPAVGLTEKQASRMLMACCRSKMSGGAMMPGCRMPRAAGSAAASHSTLSARGCLVSVRVSPVPAALTAPRARGFLTAVPAPAPPETAQSFVFPAPATCPAFRAYAPVRSPHAAPRLHGLRAPPTA